MGRPSLARSRTAGLTLIEIMVVVVIIAIGASAASLGLAGLSKAGLQSACVRLASLARYAYHRALTQSTTVRVTFDLDNETFAVSEAHGRVTLVRSDAPLRENAARERKRESEHSFDENDRDDVKRKKALEEEGAAIDPWEAAKQRVEHPDVLTLPPSPFSPITTANGKEIERFRTQPVGDNVQVVKVIVAHEVQPKTEGKADLFFFPNGLTQHAVVQLADRDNMIFSVEIHPLTGRGIIHNAPFEPELLVDDPTQQLNKDTSEVEDRN